jgi:phosphoribosylformylglycinamidine cyclo-ligase
MTVSHLCIYFQNNDPEPAVAPNKVLGYANPGFKRNMSKAESSRATRTRATYDTAGVDTRGEERGLRQLARWVTKTFDFNQAKPTLPLGYFANVLELTPDLGLAISTDGVGTKLLVAQQLGKYDTVGIDCVAMNANDIICVGARPISMVDYIAVERADPDFLGEIGKGLYQGARAAGINIPGGEIAQVREMIQGRRRGYAFDLVGTCVGIVHPRRVLIGRDIRPGDSVVGIASSGIHSNGLTLARRVLLDVAKFKVTKYLAEFGKTVGEELLVPTHIYVPEVLEMLGRKLAVKALVHITSDGLLNLARVASETGYVIDNLMEPPPIFSVIQERGKVDDAEMFRVYNMGTGFCVVVDPKDGPRVREIAAAQGRRAEVIGYAVHDTKRRVWVPQRHLVGQGTTFKRTRESPPPSPIDPGRGRSRK